MTESEPLGRGPRPDGDPIAVRAHVAGGRLVSEFVLGHGADPVRELARLGWSRPRLHDAGRDADGGLVLTYGVTAASSVASVANPVPTDPGLVLEPGEEARPHQRTAAYGVVTSDRGLLLTELSALTSAPGRWTLPGGGLELGEAPVDALHREVWEESGQEVEAVRLLEAHTSHWIGRAPSGRLEDFHAVRIVYAAWCPQPTDPVVHDVGGSTEAVRWVRRDELDAYHLSRSFAPHMRRWLAP